MTFREKKIVYGFFDHTTWNVLQSLLKALPREYWNEKIFLSLKTTTQHPRSNDHALEKNVLKNS